MHTRMHKMYTKKYVSTTGLKSIQVSMYTAVQSADYLLYYAHNIQPSLSLSLFLWFWLVTCSDIVREEERVRCTFISWWYEEDDDNILIVPTGSGSGVGEGSCYCDSIFLVVLLQRISCV